jgi:hypothetical protein
MRHLKINLAIGCMVRLLRTHSVWLTDVNRYLLFLHRNNITT